MDLRAWLVILVGAAAVIEDLRTRHISNWTCAGALVGGLVVHTWYNGFRGLGSAAGGAAIGFVVFLVFYLLGGMGGGDVKLMSGFGSLLGTDLIVHAAFLTALCGGLMAGVTLGVRALRSKLARPAPAGLAIAAVGAPGGAEGAPPKSSESIPYAPAITMGSWLALWMGR
jgi:prepilin peptidase CpaA